MQALAKLCVRRPVFATMLILSLVVVGAFSYFTLGVDLLPKVDLPIVTVTVSDPGASPEEIETEISKKIEDAVNTISDIDELRSNSTEGLSQVIIQFDLSKDGNVGAQEVQNKINVILNNLPQSAKTPVVQKLDTDAAPVMQIAVSAPRSLRDLTLIADKLIKQKLETATGVGQIQLVGGARREIHVNIDPDRLRAHGLTITDVVNAVRQQNLEIPGGALNAGTKEFTVRTMGRITDSRQFNDIAIGTQQGYVVKVSDVGEAEDSYEEPRTSGRLNGTPAVTVVVSKQSGANSVATANDVKARMKEIAATLPRDVRVQIIADQSIFIEAAINGIKHHLVMGSIFACVVIFLFLANWRTTLIAAVAIPTSIISTFALMKALNFTLNQLTMLALTLMVGIVIDDAIIVLENIYRYIEEKGMSPYEAAIEGTKEIGLAVMATTFSLLAVFLPVGFMGGIVGRFMSSFGFTSAFAIAVSLLVSFTLTPMLCSRFIKVPHVTERHAHGSHSQSSKDQKVFKYINAYYLSMLKWSMAHRKVVLVICGCTVLSLIPLMMVVGKDFTPTDDQSQFNVRLRTPEGTSLASTTQEAEAVAQAIRKLAGVEDTLTTAGGGQDAAVNGATIYVRLADVSARRDSQAELMQQTRKLLTTFPANLHTSVELVNAIGGGGSNAPIQYFIQGPDLVKLGQYSDELLARMKKIPGVTDADSTLRSGKPEVRLIIDRARAADLGVSVNSIETALNTLVAGETVSTFNAGDDQFDVRVRAGEQFRNRVEELSRITVPSSRQLAPISLDELVTVQSSTGPSSINRIDRQRQVTVSSNVLEGYSQSTILSALQKAAAEMHMDPDYTTGLAGTSKQLNQTAYYFLLAISLTFIFMYIVLAAQFESFIHPITILMTLPLAVPFGILSLVLTGQSMNIDSALGVLLLFGIVKKNAILQIDHTNGLRATGMSRYDAILQANQDRLRPILMTTLALVAGMLPLVLSNGAGAGTNRSIGVLVVGGQSLCLLLTLLAVPVFYSLFEDLSDHPLLRKPAAILGGLWARVPRIKRRTAQVVPMLAFVVLLSASAMAQETNVDAPTPHPPALPPAVPLEFAPRIGITSVIDLALPDVIRAVLENNRDVEVSRLTRVKAMLSLRAAKGYFDPVMGGTANATRAVSPQASSLGGATNGAVIEKQINADPQINGISPWLGTSYKLDFSSARVDNNNTYNTLNPTYPTAVNINLTQPLWAGLRFDANRERVSVAKKNISQTQEQFKQRVIESTTQAIRAYWELDYARRNLDVQTEAVRLIEKQDASNRRQVEQGTQAPVDVIQTQTQMATYQQNVFHAQQQLTQAENTLKTLMLPDRGDPLWNAEFRTAISADASSPVPTLEEALQSALANRPDLKAGQIGVQVSELDARLAREQAKPQINLTAQLASQGLAGRTLAQTSSLFGNVFTDLFTRVNDLSTLAGLPPLNTSGGTTSTIPGFFVGGYGQSLDNLRDLRFPTIKVGLQVSIPVRNRTARAQANIADTNRKQTITQQQQLEMTAVSEVRNTLQQMINTEFSLRAAQRGSELAQQQYESEQRQFKAGTSSVFLVLQRQTELVNAKLREIRAAADRGEAEADFDRATANTLAHQHIDIASAVPGRP